MNIFFWVFNMRVCGSVAEPIILLLRRFRKTPRRAIKEIRVLPLLRFFMPFGLYSGFGLGKLLEALSSKSFVYILSYKKMSVLASLGSCTLAAAPTALLLTN